MALIAVSGHPGCRFEEVARLAAQRLGFELLTQSRIAPLTSEEFGAGRQDSRQGVSQPGDVAPGPPGHRAPRGLLRRRAASCKARHFPGMLRVHVVAPENVAHRQPDARPPSGARRRAPAAARSGSRRPRRPQSQIRQDQGHRGTVRPGAQRRIAHHRADGRADRDRGGRHRDSWSAACFRPPPKRNSSFRCA